ncbi:MAG: glutathione S-transferase family protein [Solirubrobacteraceae bacterium]|nr:glutathione S-transferase family protein [Solirubrobacteraceae bacterium]
MIKLYESQISGNCWKVRQMLAHRELPYESIELSVVDRSNRADVIGGANPALRVPTLILDDGRPLAESNAIMLYLAEGTELIPEDPYERAQVLQWLFYEQYDHEPNIAVARFQLMYAAEPDEAAIERTQIGGRRVLATMDDHLRGRTFLVAERYTVADIALYAYTHVAGDGGFELSDYPAVQAWLARVAAQPGHITLLGD